MLGGCLGMSRNVSIVQTIRQAYRVNSKSVRLSTGDCGSAASYIPELTTPFHDMNHKLVIQPLYILRALIPRRLLKLQLAR